MKALTLIVRRSGVFVILLSLSVPVAARAGYIDQYRLATATPIFLDQVQVAMVNAAVSVRSEAPTVTFICGLRGFKASDCHVSRSALAETILSNPTAQAQIFAQLLTSFCLTPAACSTTNAIIVSTSCGTPPCTYTFTDADVQTAVNNIYDDYAIQ